MCSNDLHLTLDTEFHKDPNLVIKCHRDCVSSYTSNHLLSRALKKCVQAPEKCLTELPVSASDQLPQSLVCVMKSVYHQTEKTPSHSHEVVHCRTVERPGDVTPKDRILKTYDRMGDDQATDKKFEEVPKCLNDKPKYACRHLSHCVKNIVILSTLKNNYS